MACARPGDALRRFLLRFTGGPFEALLTGAAVTAMVQSSSATTLTALHAGTVSLHQAAAMVIGINIGTTGTAGLAALGTSTAAKRTGFNLLGVALVLPFSGRFARMVTRVIKHRGPHLTRLLDPKAARQGALATEAVRQTVLEISDSVLDALRATLAGDRPSAARAEQLDGAAAALHETEEYVASLQFVTPLSEAGHKRHVSTFHALDHLGRVIDSPLQAPHGWPERLEVMDLFAALGRTLEAMRQFTRDPNRPAPVESLRQLFEEVRSTRHELRPALLETVAVGKITPNAAGAQLDQIRWLEDLVHQFHRLADQLRGERKGSVEAEVTAAAASGE
ncbi:MAG: Na/Pi symporter [Myxococcales bacterium]|jgi:phosphate:Na+ symporter